MMDGKMKAAFLPGNSTVEFREVDIPEPGHGQVLVRTKSSTICGSDIRAIYREHVGKGPEGYQNVVAGHEPAGQIVKCGPDMRRFKEGDRVIIYHISGCGVCMDCRQGYMISCTSPYRAAYGWQRNGGMAPYILAEEKDLIPLPVELTYTDGAQVACGFGTVYEGLEKIGVSGDDAVLVVGLGPVGLATLMLARAMGSQTLIGVDISEERCRLAVDQGLADHVVQAGPEALGRVRALTYQGQGVERAIDCSGSSQGRQLAIRAARKWGRIAFVGEGGAFGRQEIDEIAPAIQDAQQEGIAASGPHPADTVFLKAVQGKFDAVVCMYHDQGHVPMKLLDFHGGVNVTLGLDVIRTSVDHGTAFDIAYKGIAATGSFLEAYKMALKMTAQKMGA